MLTKANSSFSPFLKGRKDKRKDDQLGYKNYSFFTLPLQAFIPNGFCSCCSLASHKQRTLRCAYSICFAALRLSCCLSPRVKNPASTVSLSSLCYIHSRVHSQCLVNKLKELLLVVIASHMRMGYICGSDIWILWPWFSIVQNHPIALVPIMEKVFLLLICKSLTIMPLPYMYCIVCAHTHTC